MKARILIVSLAALAACRYVAPALSTQIAPEPVAWRAAKPLPVENVGSSVFRVWTQKLALVPNPDTGAPMQLIWYKEGKKNDKISRFASLNLATGQVKVHPPMPGLEAWKIAFSGGKLYLGMNLPPNLLEYDPRLDTLRDLGPVFKSANTIASISAGPDGTIAMGGSQGGTEVAIYDPRSGKLTHLGSIGGKDHGYVYSLTHDRTHVYAVARGAGPWALFAIDRSSGAQRKLTEMPLDGYIDAKRGFVEVKRNQRDKNEKWTAYPLLGGQMGPPGHAAQLARKDEWPKVDAEVLLDTRQALDTGRSTVHFRMKRGPWRRADVPAGRDEMPVNKMLRWSPTLLVGASGPYGPLFTYDVTTGKTDSLGIPADMSVYSLARGGNALYVSGYPGTAFAKVDIVRPFTSPDSYPNEPGIPWTDRRANPYFVGRLGEVLGSHGGVAMEAGADGRVYICGQRTRYRKGFSMGWYDPVADKYGELPDSTQLDHYQVSWMTPIDQGRKLAISTRVDQDSQKSGQASAEARVFVVNTKTGAYESTFIPVRGEKMLGPILEVSPGIMIGTAIRSPSGPTLLYRYNMRTGQVLARRLYQGVICGVSSDSDLPRKGADFQVGPDGSIWTVYPLPYGNAPSLIVRINPVNLELSIVGTVPGQGLRFAFVGQDLYLTGGSHIRRLKGIVPSAISTSK